MKQGLVTLLYNFDKRFMGWTLHMIMCGLLCYPISIHMSQLLSTGRPISSSIIKDATAPQVFTMIVKEVKLMALSRGLRLHQYLDDWLIRSQSQEEAQVNTQAVVDLTQSIGWIINQEKSELNLLGCFRSWATNTI